MINIRPAVSALLFGGFLAAASAPPGFAQECACPAPGAAAGGAAYIQADQPPPPLPDYDQPPMPAPGYYWTPGYWAWNNYDYYWVPGAWVEPPQPGLLWTPGFWAFTAGLYLFHPGYWGPHVGFYGGIDYGFGYTGAGYAGGRWDDGQFYYNRAVNNLGSVRINNIYNEPITVNNTTLNRVSFNGGEGGVAARPTSAQALAAKEPHVPPTNLQRDNARVASMNGGQFVSTNKGKPAVAATPRPGELKGKGVLPAKAAGIAPQTAPAAGGNVLPQSNEKRAPLKGEGQGTNPPAAPPNKTETPPAGAPRIGERPPSGQTPVKTEPLNPKAAKTQENPAAERPLKTEPLNPGAAKIQEKPAAVTPPKIEPLNPGTAKVQEKPPAAERPAKPAAGERAAVPVAPKAPAAERPVTPVRPPAAERMAAPPQLRPAAPQAAQKPAPRPQPGAAAKECGRPGQPKCP